MLIRGDALVEWLEFLEYPVDILHHDSKRVAYTMDRQDVEELLLLGVLVGVGRKNRLKFLKLDRPHERMAVIKDKVTYGFPFAADNRTSFRQKNSGKETWSHHASRCEAYGFGVLDREAL